MANESNVSDVDVVKGSSDGKVLEQDEEEDDCSFRATFCPKRYPKSVAPEYRLFQSWDTVQQMTKLVNKHVGNLAWCGFHGVGQPSASVSRAVLFTFSRGLCKHKVSMLCTTPRATLWFSAYVKVFRTLGGTLEAISVLAEILAFQANSIFILLAAGILGAMASAMNDATRACILQHFSKEKNNHDVTLKENNQDSAGGFVGCLGGLLLVYLLGSEFDRHSGSLVMAATSCFCLCCIHAVTNLASAMVLKISPATFTLQHCKTRRFVTLTSGNTLAATADTAKAGNVEIFRLPSDQIPGKALMSVDGVWFDQDGVATDHPVASELEEDGQSVRLRDERYELGPCTRLPSSSKARSGIFFPPGWPTSMPDGYDEYMAYELVVSIVATPMSLLNYFIFWKYVAGVGDGTKSPAFACFLMLYLDFVSILCGLLSGLPMFAKHYDHRWLCLSFFLNAFATGTIVVAQVCPLPWYLLLSGLAQPFKSLAGVAGKTVSAELERRFASHPNVDLIHLKSCKRNRDTVLNLLSSILCVCYAFHMYNCSIDPSLPGMILTFFMLLSFKLAAEYKKSQVAARVLTSDQASASYDLIEDEASHQPRMEPQGTEQSSEVPTHRFTAKKFAWTLLLVAAEAAVYGGLVTTLSASKDQLEPCTERCLQFKFFGDGSAIPGTGMFPFPVKNGQDQRLLSETCVSYGGMDCDAFIGACSVSRCEERHVRRMVEDRLSRSKSKMGFIASIAVYSALNLAHDLGLEAHLLGPNDAVMLQIFASLSMAVMAACALMWASGAMELFYSPSESCGCYFRLAAVPSVVALALPLNLVSRLRSNVQQAMYAAIIESSCLRTVSFSVPYHFIETAGINGAESLGQLSLLGVKGLGCPRPGHVGVKTHNPWLLFDRLVGARSVKRWAQWLPLLSVGIILFPLLFSSSFIVYRISDLFLAWLEDWLSKHVGQPWQLDRSCGTLALFGVYSMIGMQALVIGYFLSGLWTLYSILAVQLGDWPSDPQMLARLISAKPELRWTLSIARRSYTR